MSATSENGRSMMYNGKLRNSHPSVLGLLSKGAAILWPTAFVSIVTPVKYGGVSSMRPPLKSFLDIIEAQPVENIITTRWGSNAKQDNFIS